MWTCPIELGPCSNGEYDPVPLSPVGREAAASARATTATTNAAAHRRLAPPVPALVVRRRHDAARRINACSEESTRARGTPARRAARSPCRRPRRSIPTPHAPRSPATSSCSTCRVTSSTTRVEPRHARRAASSGPRSRNSDCGEADPRVVLLGRPLHGGGVPPQRHVDGGVVGAADRARAAARCRRELMDRARRLTEAACHDQRVLLQAQALPNVGDLAGRPRRHERRGRRVPDRVLEGVHQLPRPLRRLGERVAPRRRRSRRSPRVGDAFVAPRGRRWACRSSPRTRACRRRSGTRRRYASPVDVGPAAHARIPTCASSCTTRASRPTSSRARTTPRPPTAA